VVLWGVVVVGGPGAAARAAHDPVAGLGQALRQDRDVPADADILAFRKTNLAKHTAAVRGVADLGRALVLREWRYENEKLDPRLSEIDEEAWEKLAARFDEAVVKELRQGEVLAQLATLDVLGGLGGQVRSTGPLAAALHAHLAGFTGPLVKLSGEAKSVDVRAAALRTLGRVQPNPLDASAALGQALAADEVALRRAAADAAGILLEEAFEDLRLGGGPENPGRRDALAMAGPVIPVAGRALAERDAAVRRRGAEAVRQAAVLLAHAPLTPVALEWPPPGRPLTPQERQDIEQFRAQFEREWQELAPLARVLGAQVPALDKVVADTDLQASLVATRALEGMADARLALLRRLASVPPPPGKDDDPGRPEEPLGPALREAVPVLAKRLSADEVPARLASLYVLETLGTEAAPAAGDAVKALADRDPFVRWGAARALAGMGLKGEAAARAVAGLAPLLKDDNADVRLGAATALQRYAAAAKGAVKELSAAVKDGDDEVRLRAIATLAALGRGAGTDAVPALAAALKAEDAGVRAAAAGALGRVAPQDRTAREALRQVLADPDPDVRRASGEALLRGESAPPGGGKDGSKD
jgi:HEAT repeat protein